MQANFGGVLTINGAPVGQELGSYYLKGQVGDGSVIIVVATDAPLDHRQLERLSRRALAGLARTGSAMTNGSGDYVPAAHPPIRLADTMEVVTNDAMSPLFQAVIEATEEAVYNSLLRAEAVRGLRGIVRALPIDSTVAILRRHGLIRE